MDYIDPRCECDAPTFVDFTNMTSQYDDNADDWFGKTWCALACSRAMGTRLDVSVVSRNERQEYVGNPK